MSYEQEVRQAQREVAAKNRRLQSQARQQAERQHRQFQQDPGRYEREMQRAIRGY